MELNPFGCLVVGIFSIVGTAAIWFLADNDFGFLLQIAFFTALICPIIKSTVRIAIMVRKLTLRIRTL